MLLKRKSNYYDIDAVTYLYFSHMIRVLPILKTFIILIVYIYIYNTVNKDYLCEIYLNYTLCINNQSGKVLFPYHNDYEFFSCQISVLLWKGFQLLFQWFLKSLPSYNLYIYSIHFSLQWEKTALHQYHLMNEMIFWTKRFALFMNIP